MLFKEAEFVGSFYDVAQAPRTSFPEVAFAGRSNVGKSTLINKVLNRKKLAQVSKTPGKTKALNYFAVDRKFYFVDLPGYGFAKISKKERLDWGALIESYLHNSVALKGIVHIIDSRRGMMETDWLLVDFINDINKNRVLALKTVWVLSKIDKLGMNARTETLGKTIQLLRCQASQVIGFSAINGDGVFEIRKLIREMFTK
jgi:GTP-binding protein